MTPKSSFGITNDDYADTQYLHPFTWAELGDKFDLSRAIAAGTLPSVLLLRRRCEILRDTLVLFELPAWRESKRRKPIVSSRYYFFDGVEVLPYAAFLEELWDGAIS